MIQSEYFRDRSRFVARGDAVLAQDAAASVAATAATTAAAADRRGCRRLRRGGRKGAWSTYRWSRTGPPGSTRPTSPTTPTRSPRESARERTEMAVRFALEAAKFDKVAGPVARHAAQARHPAQRHRAARADHAGRRRRNSTTSRRGSSPTYGKGKGTLDGKPINGSRHRGGDGHEPQSRQSSRRCGQLARQCRRADARATMPAGRRSPTKARRSSATRMSARCGARATTCRPTISPS